MSGQKNGKAGKWRREKGRWGGKEEARRGEGEEEDKSEKEADDNDSIRQNAHSCFL